jgi:hypothetical protein
LFRLAQDGAHGGYKVKTLEYDYSLLGPDENGNEIEIVSYHWHPEKTAVREPHLHVACAPRIHFPTSRISIERFIRMLIDYYDIQPILGGNEYREILDRNSGAFDRMASWK